MTQFDISSSKDSSKVCLIYDRACPVCRHVAEKYEAANKNIKIINARDDSVQLDRATGMGFDVNRGIIVVDGGELYFAEEAVQRLAKTKPIHGFLGFIFGGLGRYPLMVKLIYPPLTLFRKVLLKILGVSPIQQQGVRQYGLNEKTRKDNAKTQIGNCEQIDE